MLKTGFLDVIRLVKSIKPVLTTFKTILGGVNTDMTNVKIQNKEKQMHVLAYSTLKKLNSNTRVSADKTKQSKRKRKYKKQLELESVECPCSEMDLFMLNF